jgi:Trk K+ transport system NAD-binding subunit
MKTLHANEMLLRKTPSPTVKKNFKVNENQNPELSNAEPIADKIDYKQSIQFSPLQNEHDENQSTFKFEMVPVPEGR